MAASHTVETLTTYANLLKRDYAPAIITATKEQVTLLNLIESRIGKQAHGGSGFYIPLEFNYMGSTGFRAEGGELPDSTPGTWANTVVPIYYAYFTACVSGPAMALTDGDKYAWAGAWQRELAIKTRSWRQHLNRVLNGDGNGILAQVDGNPVSTTITLDNAYGLSGLNNSDVNGARFIAPNIKVDFYSGSTIRDSGGVTLTAVTPGAFPSTSAYVTASGTITSVVDGDYMYVAGSYGKEAPGMQLLIDDGTKAATFQSVTVASYPEFKSHIGYGSTPGTAEAFTDNRFMTLKTEIEDSGGGIVSWGYTSPAVWLTIGNTINAERQYVNVEKPDTAYTGDTISKAGVQIYKDSYCPDNLFLIDNRALSIHEAKPAGFLEQMDSGVVYRYGNTDQWAANYGWYFAPAVSNRQWLGKMVDIDVTSNYI